MMFRRMARAARAAVFALGLVAGVALSASGDALAQSPVVTKLSAKEAEGLFREMGYTGIETEQDLAGGVTLDRLKDFIKTYGVSLSTFLREVI